MPKLFSYGTLQMKKVQQDVFGRILIGSNEVLEKFILSKIKITDPKVIASSGTNIHPILEYTGNITDCVKGTLFDLTDEELIHADTYEVDDYKRAEITFKSGETGFVYLKNNE